MNPYVGQIVPGWGCAPAQFPPGYVSAQALAGYSAVNTPQQPIGLQSDPLVGILTDPPGEVGEACCTAQGCFCVTDIVVGNCGQCIWLIESIKSGLCELIQCGDILGDTFYCDCKHPPLKSTMLMPGIEFCIRVQNIDTAPPNQIITPAIIASITHTFYATVWGIPGDNSCAPCLY